ncbi:MAG: FHA domain-containing protein [Proteobacteria bacterium]|nr:FHA domain-containing protein [Pseudomonadota bacterium]
MDEESDLDSTAELPVLDPAVMQAEVEDHSSTDTWAALPQLQREPQLPMDTTAEVAAIDLRSALQRLAAQADRLVQLENDREQLRNGRAAAEQLATTLSAELGRLEAGARQHQAHVDELTQARLAAEARAENASAELLRLQSGGDAAAAAELARQRSAAEQRAAALDAELARLREAAVQHTSQFAELTGARAAAELRVGRLEEELQVMRAARDTATQRGEQLQQRVTELEQAQAALEARQLNDEQARSERERLHAAHTAGVMADLHAERARAMSCFESAQHLAAGRGLFEALLSEERHQAELREAELGALRQELQARATRVEEQEHALAEQARRIAALEQQISASGTALSERDSQLREARRDAQGLHLSITRLQGQLDASGERVRALTALSSQHTTSETQRKTELSRLLAERVELTAELEAARAAAVAAAAAASEHEAALPPLRARTAESEAALAAERKRAADAEAELNTLRGEMEEWASAVKAAHHERGTLQAAQARVQELERLEVEHATELLKVQSQAQGSPSRVRELEQDLVAAEEAVHRLESEARSRSIRIEELEKTVAELRAAVAEAARAVAGPATTAEVAGPADGGLRRDDETERPLSPAPDGAARLLIRTDGGREIVYVLGRKTSVGRTPDNDLQIDAKFISRHHAVILAGPTQTIIEDLNSTNGVQVNGRRITRQPLQDGDSVSIGRQQYRFAVRKNNDKR